MTSVSTNHHEQFTAPATCTPALIDARGPRFGATISTVVLAAAIALIDTPLGVALLAWQTLVFALGAVVGLRAQPYGVAYRRLVQPRLHGPVPWESAAPPRFAQAVGLGFTAVGLLLVLAGAPLAATIVLACALAAAFLNAAFSFCLGCEVYLSLARIRAALGARR